MVAATQVIPMLRPTWRFLRAAPCLSGKEQLTGIFRRRWAPRRTKQGAFGICHWRPSCWKLQPGLGYTKIRYVGNLTPNTNCAGGVDYGFEGWNFAQNKPIGCDSLVWSTGDALKFGVNYNPYPGDSETVYGLAGIPTAGNSTNFVSPYYVKTNSYYIDLGPGFKTEFGDVELFKCECVALPEFPCDSLMVMCEAISSPPNTNLCCYSIDLKNQVASQSLTKICATLSTPDWIFNTSALPPLASGWVWDLNNPTQLCIKPASGNIPIGQLPGVLTFCLAETSPNAASSRNHLRLVFGQQSRLQGYF